jgi:hypothetical protein
MAKRTRSPHPLLSSEIRWYLETRGYSLDGVTEPLIRTPEPVDVPGAVFDPVRVDQKITALRVAETHEGQVGGPTARAGGRGRSPTSSRRCSDG